MPFAENQRALVVYEHHSDANGGGKMFALDPGNATGVPLPAFRPVTAMPPTGTMIGEAVLDTTNGLSFVWDGMVWQPIVPPALVTYANDAAVLNDNAAPVGTYGTTADSGNLWVRYDTGGILPGNIPLLAWRCIGVRHFDLEATLIAWVAEADGQMAYARDTDQAYIWEIVGGAGQWVPMTPMVGTEATILASTPGAAPMMGVATDTARAFVWDGTTWVGQPFRTYATEALLTADNPADGIMAVAGDTGNVFFRFNGGWVGQTSTAPVIVSAARPGGVMGTLHMDLDGNLAVYDGTDWLTLTQGWVLNKHGFRAVSLPGYTGTVVPATNPTSEMDIAGWKNAQGHRTLLVGTGTGNPLAIMPPVGNGAEEGHYVRCNSLGVPEWQLPRSRFSIGEVSGAQQFDLDLSGHNVVSDHSPVIEITLSFLLGAPTDDIGFQMMVDNNTNAFPFAAGDFKGGSHIQSFWQGGGGQFGGYRVDTPAIKTTHSWGSTVSFNYTADTNLRFKGNAGHQVVMRLSRIGDGNMMLKYQSNYECADITPINVTGTFYLNLDLVRVKMLRFWGHNHNFDSASAVATSIRARL